MGLLTITHLSSLQWFSDGNWITSSKISWRLRIFCPSLTKDLKKKKRKKNSSLVCKNTINFNLKITVNDQVILNKFYHLLLLIQQIFIEQLISMRYMPEPGARAVDQIGLSLTHLTYSLWEKGTFLKNYLSYQLWQVCRRKTD